MVTAGQLIKEEDLWELQRQVAKLKGQVSALTDEIRVRKSAYDELLHMTNQRANNLNDQILALETKLKTALGKG